MNIYKNYNSIVDRKFVKRFCMIGENQEDDLLLNPPTKMGIGSIISAAYLLCPPMVQVRDYVFINHFWNDNEENADRTIEDLEKRFNSKKEVEMYVNAWSLGDFFMHGGNLEHLEDDEVFDQFGALMVYFWQQRANELFPDKDIVVEIGEEIMGEYGSTITMYQRR